jgi:hypothetical protein
MLAQDSFQAAEGPYDFIGRSGKLLLEANVGILLQLPICQLYILWACISVSYGGKLYSW